MNKTLPSKKSPLRNSENNLRNSPHKNTCDWVNALYWKQTQNLHEVNCSKSPQGSGATIFHCIYIAFLIDAGEHTSCTGPDSLSCTKNGLS